MHSHLARAVQRSPAMTTLPAPSRHPIDIPRFGRAPKQARVPSGLGAYDAVVRAALTTYAASLLAAADSADVAAAHDTIRASRHLARAAAYRARVDALTGGAL